MDAVTYKMGRMYMKKKTNNPKYLQYNRAMFPARIITIIWQLVSRYSRKVATRLYLGLYIIANRKRFINVHRVSGERFNNKYKTDPKKREIRNLYAGGGNGLIDLR